MFRSRRGLLGRLLLATAFAAVTGSGALPILHPATPARAATATSIEDTILASINQARVAKGLVPLRSDHSLRLLAEYRAGVMASKGILSHTIAGCLSCELTSRGIQYYSW